MLAWTMIDRHFENPQSRFVEENRGIPVQTVKRDSVAHVCPAHCLHGATGVPDIVVQDHSADGVGHPRCAPAAPSLLPVPPVTTDDIGAGADRQQGGANGRGSAGRVLDQIVD
jgi:hypothetical protein